MRGWGRGGGGVGWGSKFDRGGGVANLFEKKISEGKRLFGSEE